MSLESVFKLSLIMNMIDNLSGLEANFSICCKSFSE